ncbi:MAG: toll/interleukin-1 receptor domain-containing protein [Planctomycetota bacterium]|nr:toll/interleukin-1 receptor domain-containing protein [Planctomycetota bacterium]
MTKVFVSYCHAQSEWVGDRLVPVLKAGGAHVLIDRERFEAGKAILGQMDAVQDQAERQLLVLSPEYLASKPCAHEMQRAIDLDPDFSQGTVIPVLRADCKLPNQIKRPNPLYVNLQDDRQDEPWDKLLAGCGADLSVSAPHWLNVRDELRQLLSQDYSVNLVVSGEKVAWRAMIQHLADEHLPGLVQVDFNSGSTIKRPGLLREMLGGGEATSALPDPPDDLSRLQEIIESRPGLTRIALLHFDLVRQRNYGIDLFSTLRFLVGERRKIALLIESRQPFDSLLPPDAPTLRSWLDLKTVELRGRL